MGLAATRADAYSDALQADRPSAGTARVTGAFALLISALLVVFLLELAIGAVAVPLREVVSSLLTGESDRTTWTRIVLQFRLPRALNAIFSGGHLALVAFSYRRCFAIHSPTRMCSASSTGRSWVRPSSSCSPASVGVLMTLSSVKGLNALLLGEDYARTVGLDVGRLRLWAFLCTAILSGTVTAFCGPIAFVGLVVAHLCRGLSQTADHRILMPACVLMGSVMALSTDLLTHLPWAKHFLHLNAVNGVLGAPIVMWVIVRQRNRRALEL